MAIKSIFQDAGWMLKAWPACFEDGMLGDGRSDSFEKPAVVMSNYCLSLSRSLIVKPSFFLSHFQEISSYGTCY